LLLYRRGKFAEAEAYFRKAIERVTARNPNPYDGEPYYNLGLALKMQGRYRAAFDAFYKAVWNAAWQDSAYFELARLATRAGDHTQARDLLDNALRRNWSHHKARHLKIALLRRLGRNDQAREEAARALELDAMDIGVMWELRLLGSVPPHPPAPSPTRGEGEQNASAVEERDLPLSPAWERGPGGEGNHVEIALDYLHAGLFDDALAVLEAAPKREPMTLYFMGNCYVQKGETSRATEAFRQAAALPTDYCFPHRLESVPALQSAIEANPADARALYYLGNLWYAHRRYAEAIACWEQACELDPAFPTAFRNLGLAYFNKLHDPERALAAYERAFALNLDDARVCFELDQLAKKLNRTPLERLARLEQHRDLVDRRDDLTLEYITLLNMSGRDEQAYAILLERKFHPWEGGEGKTTGQYVASLIAQARRLLAAGEYHQAVERLERALVYPHNLGEGKLPNAQANNIHYYRGLASAAAGDAAGARACFERAATGPSEPTSAIYYNDQPPDMIFYQGLALHKLGRSGEARQIFQRLVDYGQAHLDDAVKIDYFAVSLPTFLVFDEDLTQRNQTHCYYIMALGHLGLGHSAEAQQCFDQVLALDANHQGAMTHRLFEVHA